MEPNRNDPNHSDPIRTSPASLANLVDEYGALVPDINFPNWELIEAKLIDIHEWTPDAAHSLVMMAKQYGWFFLRNATALAIACEQEDGDLGI
ncbi:MAG: hypothetical protein KDB00_17870 [Planctomycetales bacterium]|nr:hypothetical protein [Planctomycetales bacterium]